MTTKGFSSPVVDIDVLRNAVIPNPGVAYDFVDWKTGSSHGPDKSFEDALARRTDVAPCRGPYRIHEWERKEVIE